jgi:hypothetical protein
MVETLYFKCYYAYLLGNLPQAIMFYELLKEEFKSAGQIGTLKDYQLFELKKVKEAITSGTIAQASWLNDSAPIGPPMQSTAGFRQDALVWKIHQNFGQLKVLLQDENLCLYNLEHPCDPYGRVDMVYMGKNTVYPLEVKKDQGDHSLIGQIGKYCLYHQLKLHYKFYEFVQPVTVCSSYDPYAIQELKKNGVKTVIYSVSGDNFNLKLI